MKFLRTLLLACLLAACACNGTQGQKEETKESVTPATSVAVADTVTMAFAYVGCNRVGWSEETDPATGQKVPLPVSTANEPQLLQTFKDVAALSTKPAYLFLCGDIVRNEQPGTAELTTQLNAWQTLYLGTAIAQSKDTVVVPFVGNHEVLVSVEYADGDYYETPNPAAYSAWGQWLTETSHFPAGKGNGPAAGGPDLLVGDNSQQTYSFDAPTADGKLAHFIVLDTDSLSSYSNSDSACYQPNQESVTFNGKTIEGTMAQPVPGWIALDWITQDIDKALADPKTDAIFVLGHKPILNETDGPDTPSTGRDTIFNCGDKQLAAQLFAKFQAVEAAGKFGGYLCAHQHLWNATQLKGASGPPIWQVIAGNGGTKLQKGDQFGFTYVEIHSSGKITATSYGRQVPAAYYYAPTDTPAKPVGAPIILRN